MHTVGAQGLLTASVPLSAVPPSGDSHGALLTGPCGHVTKPLESLISYPNYSITLNYRSVPHIEEE